MNKPFSVFIMDITNSSKFLNGEELTEYLSFWENTLTDMTDFLGIKAKYHFGDEIICVADDYYSAVMLSYYMIYNWKYENFMPYFGISFGESRGEIEDVDIWNHPSIKKARQANEKIKFNASRDSLIYIDTPKNCFSDSIDLNLIVQMQTTLIKNQTNKQREILGLYSLLDSQKEVADILNRKPPTISKHFKKGNVEIIIKNAENILSYFIMLQVQEDLDFKPEMTYELNLLKEKYKKTDKIVKGYLFDRLEYIHR